MKKNLRREKRILILELIIYGGEMLKRFTLNLYIELLSFHRRVSLKKKEKNENEFFHHSSIVIIEFSIFNETFQFFNVQTYL